MPKENKNTEDKVIEAMMQENVEMYKRPAKIWKSLITALFVGFVIVTLILMMTGAYYVLCFFMDGKWR